MDEINKGEGVIRGKDTENDMMRIVKFLYYLFIYKYGELSWKEAWDKTNGMP